jgi:DNA-binding PadR family transcriptional regulator
MLIEPALLILVSLADEPKHGYAIMKNIERLTGWSMRAGTLYGALARIEGAGWIEEIQSDDYRRRPYALTRAGERELASQASVLRNLATAAVKRSKQQNVTKRRA